ncbi:MAG TPA: OsmC family protein [Jiangellaceae bacterium]|nr:OsmC family protein [Jiangellaceae bacterium]
MTQVTENRIARNGVDTPTLFATLDAVNAQPELANFQFRATNRWVSGTHSQGVISGFYGAGQEQMHAATTVLDADHPAVLTGADHGPAPVEYVLHALAACLTAGLINIAAARGIDLTEVESTVEGDIDLMGILGLSDEVRNGYRQIRVNFRIKGDAPEETLRGLLERSRSRSAVYDIVTNGVPVTVNAQVG